MIGFRNLSSVRKIYVRSAKLIMSIVQQPGVQVTITTDKNLFEIYETNNTATFVKALLNQAYTSSLEEKDALGYTLLHKACLRYDTMTVATLLFVGASPGHHTLEGVSSIHLAASRGLIVILNLLVKAGGNLDHRDSQGRIALHYAADAGQVLTLAWLLHHPNSAGRPDSGDFHGITPLHLACARGHCKALEYMMHQSKRTGYPLNVAVCDRTAGNTCLHAIFVAPSITNSPRHSCSDSSDSCRNVSSLVWPLLLWQPSITLSLSSDKTGDSDIDGEKGRNPLVSICQVRNHANETAFDVAKGAGAGVSWQVLLLFRIFHHLLAKRPYRAHHRLLQVYSSVWWLLACLPLLSSLVSLVSVSLLFKGYQWIHFLTCLGLLWLATRQRHRLDDGTDRPNPFFAGTVWTGLIVTSFSFLVDISLPYLFWLWVWLSASAVALLFLRLILVEPASHSLQTGGLAELVETQSQLVYSQLHDIRLDTTSTQKLAQLNDLYCPYCDLLTGDSAFSATVVQRKHCSLCKRCFTNLDHHCLFVMRCVYDQNQRVFLLFLLASACFTGAYALAATRTVWSECYPGNPSESLAYLLVAQVGHCAYRELPHCLVLWPLNLASCVWACVLANDQCLTLATNQPYYRRYGNKRYRSCLCSAWLLHWRTVLTFLVTGRRPLASGARPV